MYRCPSCGGLSQRKRQGLATLRAFGFSVLAFPMFYWVLLRGFSVWTIPSVIGALAVIQILNIAIDAPTNDYIAAEYGEP